MIHPKKEFLEIVKKEQVRTDRTGSEFSVILFTSEYFTHHDPNIKGFVSSIRERIRSYDDIGWFEENSLGILLPETIYEKAKIVAGEIFQKIIPKKYHTKYSICSYPTKWFSNKDEVAGCENLNKPKNQHDQNKSQDVPES
jgi:hypothetical protein